MKNHQQERYGRTLGYFCSATCLAQHKRAGYSGEKNPNWKGRTHDCDGYRVVVPPASLSHVRKKIKLHTAVCLEVLGLEVMPNGSHIHHRDCSVENNDPKNLVVLDASDHKWIHKQYGVATLWAFMNGKIDLDEMVSWSDDKDRASRILPLDVTMQSFSNDKQKGEIDEDENKAA